jgi:hypothetical protein
MQVLPIQCPLQLFKWREVTWTNVLVPCIPRMHAMHSSWQLRHFWLFRLTSPSNLTWKAWSWQSHDLCSDHTHSPSCSKATTASCSLALLVLACANSHSLALLLW